MLTTVTSFVLFFGISSLIYTETSQLGIYLLPPCFAALLLSLSLLVRQTLIHLRHLFQQEGIGIFDKVTGAHNRYYLEQRLDAEVARSNRYNAPLALVSVAISGFDSIIDEYGHQAGDMAASLVARTLKEKLRETDVISRFNTGCFLLILPDTPEGNVYSLVSRLRNALNRQEVIQGKGAEKSLCISVRFGISTCTLSTSNSTDMISRSLQALADDKTELGVKVTPPIGEELCEPS